MAKAKSALARVAMQSHKQYDVVKHLHTPS